MPHEQPWLDKDLPEPSMLGPVKKNIMTRNGEKIEAWYVSTIDMIGYLNRDGKIHDNTRIGILSTLDEIFDNHTGYWPTYNAALFAKLQYERLHKTKE